jgi:hypothetical protein
VDPEQVRHAVCAREEIHHAREGTLIVTANDIFTPPEHAGSAGS